VVGTPVCAIDGTKAVILIACIVLPLFQDCSNGGWGKEDDKGGKKIHPKRMEVYCAVD
jgi:hypothetical protein